MKKPEKWQSRLFIGSLACIAIFINFSWRVAQVREANPNLEAQQTARRRSEPEAVHPNSEHSSLTRERNPSGTPTQPPASERIPAVTQKTPEQLAAEQAQFVARYVNPGVGKISGMETLAVVAVSENGRPNSPLATALASRIKSDTIKVLSSSLTPEFISDGLFNATFLDSAQVARKLELKKVLDTLLLSRQTVVFSTNASLENVITANMRLEGLTVPVGALGDEQAWSFTANGAGFTPSDARRLAEERLLKQIAADTNILLKSLQSTGR